MRKEKTKSFEAPKLDVYLPEGKKRYVTYQIGAEQYEVEVWTFSQWAKAAGATQSWKRRIVVDLDILDAYLQKVNINKPKRRKRRGEN